MKKAIPLLTLAFLFACSSDDNNADENSKLKLKSITTIYGHSEFIYGPNGYVSEVKYKDKSSQEMDYSTLYTYDGNNVTDIIYTKDNIPFHEIKYTYNNSNISKAEEKGDGYSVQRLYTYDSSNNIIQEDRFVNGEPDEVYMFTYQNSNVINKTVKLGGGDTYTLSYKYDNKNNPYKNTFPDSFLKVLYEGNNNKVDVAGNVTTHVYNKDGFPTISDDKESKTTYIYY